VLEQLEFSLRHVWFICAPMAAMVVFFHADILRVLCLGGKYTMDDLHAARQVAVFYGLGIPFFCSLKVLLPAFYARKQMKTPFYISLAAIMVNIVLNLILMIPLKQGGLALATVISSLTNNSLLLLMLRRQGFALKWYTLLSPLRSMAMAAVSASAVWLILQQAGITISGLGSIGKDILLLIAIGGAFTVCYFVLAMLCRSKEIRELAGILQRRRQNS